MTRVSQCRNSEYGKVLNKAGFWECERYAAYLLDMPEYALTEFWIYVEFEICQDSEYGRVLNMRELHRVLCSMQECHNITEYVWTGCEYAWNSEFSIIGFWVCIMQYIVQSHSKCQWVLTEILLIQNSVRFDGDGNMERFGKIIVVFNYFCKKFHLKSLRGFCTCVEFWICQSSEYS